MPLRSVLTLVLALSLAACTGSTKKPFMSRLEADKNSPLYATYAAAMERSEFALDEGYEFHFYKEDEGLDFTTDTGGDICLGFFINGDWVYLEEQLFQKPVITMSYPDLVRYHYYPVEGLRVDATFLVQSSHAAIQDVTLRNESSAELEIGIVPFLRNDYRNFFDIRTQGDSAVFFTHEEFPDGWTVSHEVPCEDTIRNILLVSEAVTTSQFNATGRETPVVPVQVDLQANSRFRLAGRAFRNGERVDDQPPAARIQLFVNDDQTRMITENSPLKGTIQPPVDKDGYFQVELGHFGEITGKTYFEFTYYTERDGTAGILRDTVREGSFLRADIDLKPYAGPGIPEVSLEGDGRELKIAWKGNADSWRVYRRTYPEPLYHQVARLQGEHFYADTDLDPEAVYGYVVVAEEGDRIGMHSREVRNIPKVSFSDFTDGRETGNSPLENARVIAMKSGFTLPPGGEHHFRLVRQVARPSTPDADLLREARILQDASMDPYIAYNESLFSRAPEISFEDPDKSMLYWSAYNMMRQVFLPPEAKSSYNYYVFSREPTWGWGHGGQVFHESITMLAYAHLDPESAMNSQRVYRERQYENGYINYRTGGYLDEIIEHEGQLTSSAPWYAWQNWEVYRITRDKVFLQEMYASSKAFYNFYVSNRDSDQDGLCEWGGHAVLESVRDALVAVWDEVGWPADFEGVDVNSMLVKEAKALENMARELGLEEEAAAWEADHTKRSALINDTFWDETDGFYYHADKKDNDFTFESENDLKRQEIIGFLPMWAGVATQEQADRLVKSLFDEKKFWRKYGVPSLAADDPYYNDKGYWNGPVWVEWDLFIVQALLDYGYEKEAKELVGRIADGMILQLKENHNLWEFYSPDTAWAGYHRTYIWAGIINRMMVDVKDIE